MRKTGWSFRSVGATIALLIGLSDCSRVRGRICNTGEHVVNSIDAPRTGRACAQDGKPPPEGYEDYPAGKVPTYIDEGD